MGARYEKSPLDEFGARLKYLDAGLESRVYDGGNTDIRLLRTSSTAATVRGVATAAKKTADLPQSVLGEDGTFETLKAAYAALENGVNEHDGREVRFVK